MQAERAFAVLPSPAPEPRRADPPVHVGVYDGPLDLLLFIVRREDAGEAAGRRRSV